VISVVKILLLPSTLDPRLAEGSAFGLGLRAEGCFVRGEAGGGARDYRAEWGGEEHAAQDSFAGSYSAEVSSVKNERKCTLAPG
jgi:hypothetical protein